MLPAEDVVLKDVVATDEDRNSFEDKIRIADYNDNEVDTTKTEVDTIKVESCIVKDTKESIKENKDDKQEKIPEDVSSKQGEAAGLLTKAVSSKEVLAEAKAMKNAEGDDKATSAVEDAKKDDDDDHKV
ncbi:unnamed protein product, partial [Amoebophrya sp. A25]|eukprot:GSA25T00017215001.1